jgi:hypothetical protein
MTDRHAGYLVTLTEDTREDDAERIITALSMVKGVLSVDPLTADASTLMGEVRARLDLVRKVMDALDEVRRG